MSVIRVTCRECGGTGLVPYNPPEGGGGNITCFTCGGDGWLHGGTVMTTDTVSLTQALTLLGQILNEVNGKCDQILANQGG